MKDYDKKILHSIFTVLSVVAITVITIVLSYFVIYGPNGTTLIRNKDKKALSYANKNISAKHGCVVFLGDSITEMCKLEKYYPTLEAHNRGISGDTTDGMLKRLETNVLSIQPSTLVILGGTNDLDRGITPQEVADNIRQIVKTTKSELPDCKILVQSIYPVNAIRKPTFLNKVYSRNNENIDMTNQLLKDICDENNCAYIDVNSQLKDEEGNLKKQYSKDGLHLTKSAYYQVASIVTPCITDLHS